MMAGRNKATSIIEYSVFIALFVAALTAMQIYVKRAMQGRIRGVAQNIGGGDLFSPELSRYRQVTSSSSVTEETTTPDGKSVSTLLEPSVTLAEPFTDDFSGTGLREEGLFE
jgi:hypothetical protein